MTNRLDVASIGVHGIQYGGVVQQRGITDLLVFLSTMERESPEPIQVLPEKTDVNTKSSIENIVRKMWLGSSSQGRRISLSKFSVSTSVSL